ncbi:MAG: SDR family oxidoreductase [Alphaproteobacteria bacterium]|nr:SDR family oxidoreductase [Alphaproteobacteria bacterium]
MRLANKSAIVTGAGSGIGAGIAIAFAAAGAQVAVVDIDQDRAETTAEAIRSADGTAIAFTANVADAGDVGRFVTAAADLFGGLDILVNNAGKRVIRPFLDHSEAEWRQMLDVNLTAHFLTCQAAVPHLLARGTGRIVNVVSVAGLVGRPNRAGYCASKGGAIAFTRALAADLSGTGVTVNAVNPGLIATPFNARFSENAKTGPQWANENLAGRWGTPEDVAAMALFLASDEAGYVSGECFNVDGGSIAALVRSGE